MSKKRVLYLCTGNSARSQMAEGLTRALLGDTWEAYSAGTAPSGYVHEGAIAAMAELDIDITDQTGKSVAQYVGQPFDLVITVCDNAAQTCPAWLGQGEVRHIGFPDPAAVEGTEDEVLTTFREVRDGIRERILGSLEGFSHDMEHSRKA